MKDPSEAASLRVLIEGWRRIAAQMKANPTPGVVQSALVEARTIENCADSLEATLGAIDGIAPVTPPADSPSEERRIQVAGLTPAKLAALLREMPNMPDVLAKQIAEWLCVRLKEEV